MSRPIPAGGRPAARRRAPPPDEPQPEMAPDPGETLAVAARECYTAARRLWEARRSGRPSYYAPASAYDGRPAVLLEGQTPLAPARPSEWLALARWCRERGAPLLDYIREAFASLPPTDVRPPEPAQLRSERFAAAWRLAAPARAELVLAALRTEGALLARKVTVEQSLGGGYDAACALVLDSESSGLSPLYRYCACRRLHGRRFLGLAAALEGRAVFQFEHYRVEYLAHWPALLPPGFPARSEQLYPAVLAAINRRWTTQGERTWS